MATGIAARGEFLHLHRAAYARLVLLAQGNGEAAVLYIGAAQAALADVVHHHFAHPQPGVVAALGGYWNQPARAQLS